MSGTQSHSVAADVRRRIPQLTQPVPPPYVVGYGRLWSLVVLLCLSLQCLTLPVSGASIVLPACFQENMVLQSAEEIVVWGWSDLPDVEVEFQGKKARTETKKTPGLRKGWGRWEATIHDATNSGPANLIIRAGKDPYLGRFVPEATKEIKNVRVGEVWLWFARNHTNSPRAALSAEQAARLSRQCRVIKVPGLNSLIASGAPPEMTWNSPTTKALSAEACFFVEQRTASLKSVPVGIVEVPWTNVLTIGSLDTRPATNWLDMQFNDDGLKGAFLQAHSDASALFKSVTTRHARDVNQLKLLGIVTNAVWLEWHDMNDFNRVQLSSPTNIVPFKVRGVIW